MFTVKTEESALLHLNLVPQRGQEELFSTFSVGVEQNFASWQKYPDFPFSAKQFQCRSFFATKKGQFDH